MCTSQRNKSAKYASALLQRLVLFKRSRKSKLFKYRCCCNEIYVSTSTYFHFIRSLTHKFFFTHKYPYKYEANGISYSDPKTYFISNSKLVRIIQMFIFANLLLLINVKLSNGYHLTISLPNFLFPLFQVNYPQNFIHFLHKVSLTRKDVSSLISKSKPYTTSLSVTKKKKDKRTTKLVLLKKKKSFILNSSAYIYILVRYIHFICHKACNKKKKKRNERETSKTK